MARLTIYLDPKTSALIERAAKRDSMSLSRWAREKLTLAAGSPAWPRGYADLIGSISDTSFESPSDQANRKDQTVSFSE